MVSDLINGEIPDHWEFTTLGDVCQRGGGSIQTGPFGSQLHASDYVSDGIPSIMPTNIGDNRIVEDGIVRVNEEDANRLSQHRLRAGDIIYSRRGDIEKRALIREREEGWLCGTGCLKVRLGSGVVDPLFGSMFLGHPAIREWIVRHAVGATMPNLNTSIMSAVPFAIPPIAEQKAIAAVLGTLDDKIEMNRRMNAKLEEMARALFQSWFVDFDPVRAKLDGREPIGLDSGTAALFPAHLEDSPLGQIPKGWKACPLAELIEVVKGRSYRSEELAESKTALVTLKSFLRGGGYRTDGLKPFTGEYKPNQQVRAGDLVVAFTDVTQAAEVIGKPALVRNDDLFEALVASLDVGIVRPKSKQVSIPFLYCLFLTAEFQAHTYSHATGTTVLHLGSTAIPSFVYVVPPVEIAEKFADRADPIFHLIDENAKQSRTLAILRDTLLPKLLSGELSAAKIH